MSDHLRITTKNDLAELGRLSGEIEVFLQRAGAGAAGIYATNLALEEMFTNIVKYGYDDTLTHEILVSLHVESDNIILVLEDDGHEFNPLTVPAPDVSLPLAKRKIGGLGIHIVRRMVENMDYRRANNRNILTLTTRLRP